MKEPWNGKLLQMNIFLKNTSLITLMTGSFFFSTSIFPYDKYSWMVGFISEAFVVA